MVSEVLIDVVTETKINQTFFTEKTWKPLLGLRLPLYLHTQGCYGELKGMGFNFPDWLRVDYIDKGIDSYARCRRIIEVLNDLKDEEPAELWYAAKPTLIHNQRRAKQLALMVEPCEPAEGLIESRKISNHGKFLNFFSLQINDLRGDFLDFSSMRIIICMYFEIESFYVSIV